MTKQIYYNPCNLSLSGREYIILQSFDNGTKQIQFPTFANKTIIAKEEDLNGTYKKACDKMWQEEKERIARVHGWN